MDWKKALRSPIGAAIPSGLLASYPIGRAPRPVQVAFVAVPVGIGAAFGYFRKPHAGEQPDDQGRRIVGAVGAATALATWQLSTLLIDRGTERLLRRLNVPAPRLAIGLGAGVANAALSITLDRWVERHSASDGLERDTSPD